MHDSQLHILSPQGFRAGGLAAGIKASGKPDMALIVNDGPACNAAAVFTRNKVFAAPVKVSKEVIAGTAVRAVVINSGNANACTGSQGLADARAMQQQVAQNLELSAGEVLVCSTGIIGESMPMDIVKAGIDSVAGALGCDSEHADAAATAILTTDKVVKHAGVQCEGWSVGAIGKGAGMMAPSLATMLVCITTDALVPAYSLDKALRRATQTTFDQLDIDGSTSTNDTVVVMSSGSSGITPTQAELDAALLAVCEDLAQQMQSDAEGVTKRVTITVEGALNDEQALDAARTIGRDTLVKCAMFGEDPNWGRVLAAVGMANARMEADAIDVYFNGQAVCRNSTGVPGARDVDLSGPEIQVTVDLGTGRTGKATVRTTDLSHDYVNINSAYTT